MTGVDDALQLEAVYYSYMIPRNAAVLTVMGAVFDKIYFPGVYMPKGYYDQAALDKEITRIQELPGGREGAHDDLLGILNFTRHAKTLEEFCVFSLDTDKTSDDDHRVPQAMAEHLFDAIHGPRPANWEPMLETRSYKSIPESDETIIYPGHYHYMSGAILEAGRRGIPLLSDLNGLPIPGLEQSSPINDAKALSAILAIECTKVALPELPVLHPTDLMEFRAENGTLLRTFRRSMLRYAADLNGKLAGATDKDIEQITRFFVTTEIVPVLDELRSNMHSPATPWLKRALNAVRAIPEVVTNFMTMEPNTAVAKTLATYAGQFLTEVIAEGDKKEALKRSGLYYLLQLQTYQADRSR